MTDTEKELTTATEEESAKLDRLANAFMSETTDLGDWQIRKPSIAGLQILAKTGNRFVVGFTTSDIRKIFPNGDPEEAKSKGLEFEVSSAQILQYLDDLIQLLAVCQADTADLRKWYFDQESFLDSVFHLADSIDLTSNEDHLSRLFNNAFELIAEISEAEVESAPAPGPKKPKKKRPPARRSSSPTRARSRKKST